MARFMKERLPKFVLALVTFLALTVGLPVVLVFASKTVLATSSPLPTSFSADGVSAYFSRRIGNTEIAHIMLRIALTAGWLIWAWFGWHLAVAFKRAVATARQTVRTHSTTQPAPARFEPRSVSGRSAGLAGWIASALVVVGSTVPAVAAGAVPARTPVAVQVSNAPTSSIAPSLVTVAPDQTAREVSLRTVVVQHGDTAETIAAARLGSPDRWPELWELNGNEIVNNVTGERWTEQWRLKTGWTLQLPDTPTPQPSVETPPDRPAAASGDVVTVRSGDNLWGIIEHNVGSTTPQDIAAVSAANEGVGTPDGPWLLDAARPDLIYPGMPLDLGPAIALHHPTVPPAAATPVSAPPPDVPVPTTGSTTSDPDLPDTGAFATAGNNPVEPPATPLPTPTAPTSTAAAAADSAPPPTVVANVSPVLPVPIRPGLAPPVVVPIPGRIPVADQPGDAAATLPVATVTPRSARRGGDVVPVALGLAGMSMAAMLALLERKRRQRHARVQPGHHVPVPSGELAGAEQVLRAAARLDRVDRVNGALRHLAVALSDCDFPVRSQYVAVNDDDVIVMLDRPLQPPPGWVLCPNGLGWRCELDDVGLRYAADCNPHPWPAMVPLGVTEDGTDILIDIEGLGITAFTGELAGQVIGALVCSLSSSPTTGAVNVVDDDRVVLHGLGQFLENRLTVTTVNDMLGRLQAWVEPWSFDECHLLTQRYGDPGQMEPCVAVIVTDIPAEGRVTLESLECNGTRPIAVITSDPTVAHTTFDIDHDGHTTVCGFDIRCHRVTSVVATALIDLFDQVDTTPENPNQPTAPVDGLVDNAASMVAVQLFATSHAPTWELGILGLLRISHPTFGELAAPRVRELFTLLALHSRGLTGDDIYDRLFSDKAVDTEKKKATVKARGSDLRKVLGNGDVIAGRLNFPTTATTGSELYRLDDVNVDANTFLTLLNTADTQDDPTASVTLTAALELVYGEIGKGELSNYAWSTTIVQQLVVAVTRAGERLATIALAAGDAVLADWAATQTRLAVPFDQTVVPIAIAARTALGDRHGVRRLHEELSDTHDGQFTPEVQAAFARSLQAS
jgi:hypothetical protein